ncbi:type VI secretion system tip protein VgrG [Ralstonia insidiosa]|nr:type VI secretion system tip protein VgrG [Ralstonia insidiosa]
MFKFNQARTLELVGECLPTYGIKQPLLIPAHLHGTEAIGSLFEYTLTCRTANTPNVSLEQAANIDLNALLKQEVTLHIQIEGIQRFAPGRVNMENVGAGVREISAIIDQAEMLGEETERSYLYRFRLRPWLSLAETGQKRRLFHNMSVVDITRAVLEAYPYAVEYRLNAPWGMDYWPLREVQRQHDESDAVFLHRLWQEWGIFYHFKHENGRHCLVLNNKIGALQRHGEAYQTIRYTGPAEKRTDEETIHTLSIANKLVTGPVTINDYDYSRSNDAVTRAGGGDFQFRSDAPHDHVHTEQAHDMWGDFSQPKAGASGIADAGNEAEKEAQYLASVMAHALHSQARLVSGAGNLRGLMAGYTLHIVEHPQKAANCEYSVLSATLTAEEVAQSSGVGQYRYSASFTLLPQSCLFYLPRTVPKPNIGGTEYAMVIAPAGAPAASETWTDSLGRVLIRYLWAGKSEHGDAPNSMWVRVLSPWQGSEFGATFLPRIGHEVEVAFVGGDPDLPVIIGSATNHWRHPGYALPGNAALAGFRSREFGQHASSNTVVMDDTQGKIQAQIASDHGTSHLALGYNTRIAGTQGRQDERGRGFELRTDLWGVLRSGLGMLISTDKREQARGHAKDAGEAIQRLTQARDIHETQAQLARQHLAHDGTVNQDDVVTAIKAQAQAIRGNAATPEAPFPEFDQPHLTLASPAGIQTATAGSTHVASDVHTALTSGKHISLSAGRSLMATVRDRISLFAYKLGVRITAASGRVEIEAQNDQLSVIAHKVVDIISKADWINLTGQQAFA